MQCDRGKNSKLPARTSTVELERDFDQFDQRLACACIRVGNCKYPQWYARPNPVTLVLDPDPCAARLAHGHIDDVTLR